MRNLLIAIPQIEVHRPPISTAVIAGVIRHHGYNLQVLDLNIKLFHQLGRQQYYSLSSVWEKTRPATEEEDNLLNKFIERELIPHCSNDTRLLISVFTNNSWLLQ